MVRDRKRENMLLTKELKIKINNRNIEHYRNAGYKCIHGDILKIKIKDVAKLCKQEVSYKCDKCGDIHKTKFSTFSRSHENVNDITYCNKCANYIIAEQKHQKLMEYLAHDGIKKCSRCNNEYPADTDHFFLKCDTHDGFVKYCKECMGKSFTNYLTHIPKSGYKFCIKCDSELPTTIQYFPPDSMCKDGLRNVCRCCGKDGHYMEDNYIPVERWSKDDLFLLKSIYPDYTNEELINKFFPNRTKHALDSQADKNGYAWKSKETYERSKIIRAIKVGNILRGRKMPEDTKRKLSESKLEYYKTHASWWLGKKRSKEQCTMISERNTRIGKWRGENNPRHIEPLAGSLNGNWQGGITNFYQELRSDTKDWFNESAEFCDYLCVITGLGFDNIHHTTPFKDIVEDSFNICGLDKRSVVSDYSISEFDNLTDTLKEHHDKYGFGACVTKEVHKLFHETCGYKNFTAYDFLDFVYRIDIGEYDDWFSENNLLININYEYIEYLESTLSTLERSA